MLPKGTVPIVHPEHINTQSNIVSFHRGGKEINLSDYTVYGQIAKALVYDEKGDLVINVAALPRPIKAMLTAIKSIQGAKLYSSFLRRRVT